MADTVVIFRLQGGVAEVAVRPESVLSVSHDPLYVGCFIQVGVKEFKVQASFDEAMKLLGWPVPSPV